MFHLCFFLQFAMPQSHARVYRKDNPNIPHHHPLRESTNMHPRHPRQQSPQAHINNQHRQNDRLQHLHALRLRNSADGKRQHTGATAAKRGGKADGADVQVFGEEFSGGHDGSGEEGPEEEAEEGDCDGGDEEVGEEPEQ